MARYSQALLIVALFCFLLPFSDIALTSNSQPLRFTGWDMLSSQNLHAKDSPITLNVPLRVQILIAVICAVAAVVMKLPRQRNLTIAVAAAVTVAAVSLLALIGSSPGLQVTDGHNIQALENVGVKLLPGFYCSLIFMLAAAVASWMGLQRQPNTLAGARLPVTPVGIPRPQAAPLPGAASGVAAHSFCIKCGDALFPSARFCNRCGTRVAATLAGVAAVVTKPPEIAVPPQAPAETSNVAASATVAASMAPAAEPRVVPVPPPFPVTSAAVVTEPPATTPPVREEAAHPAASAQFSASAAQVAAPAPPTPPPPVPSPVPHRAQAPSVALPRALQPRFSAGAKLGVAAASVIVIVGVWLAFHHSADNNGSWSAPTAISIYPDTIRVAPGQTVRLQAMVTGGINREVQWSIQEGTPGGSVENDGATVQNGNVFQVASYKAPAVPGVYHVEVVSTADQSRKAVVQIYVSYGFPRF